MNIYVGNLSYNMTEDTLKTMFSEFGEISSVKVIMDSYSGRSKGFGFVEMPDNSQADQAVKNLNGKLIDGRNIKVNQAQSGSKRDKKSFSRKRY